MTSGGNNFIDFPETVPTGEEITTKMERIFHAFSSVAVRRPAQLLNGPNAAASLEPALIQHCIS